MPASKPHARTVPRRMITISDVAWARLERIRARLGLRSISAVITLLATEDRRGDEPCPAPRAARQGRPE